MAAEGHRDDWFRSARWGGAAEEEFRTRLARARPHSRYQYRRIKAIALLGSGDETRGHVGEALLNENLALADLPGHERVLDLCLLAGHFQRSGRSREAEACLREALAIGGPDGSGTSGEEEIALAEILIERGGGEDLEEAGRLLNRRASKMPLFVRSRYRLAVACARLYVALHQGGEAANWARAALELAETSDSGLTYHPDLGLVSADEAEVQWLRKVGGYRS